MIAELQRAGVRTTCADDVVDEEAITAHAAFRAFALERRFPCVGARSVVRRSGYRFRFLPPMDDAATGEMLAAELTDALEAGHWDHAEFATLVAAFRGPRACDEGTYEELLWSLLQRLHEADAEPWTASASPDPDDPEFAFSFGGRAFFVIGLHARSSRLARRFAWPALVFNAHAQFDALRATGKYDRFRDAVRNRDLALQGSINPMVTDYGTVSEARQYSGRAVEPDWRCPFHA